LAELWSRLSDNCLCIRLLLDEGIRRRKSFFIFQIPNAASIESAGGGGQISQRLAETPLWPQQAELKEGG
jgi:hypothetical protein